MFFFYIFLSYFLFKHLSDIFLLFFFYKHFFFVILIVFRYLLFFFRLPIPILLDFFSDFLCSCPVFVTFFYGFFLLKLYKYIFYYNFALRFFTDFLILLFSGVDCSPGRPGGACSENKLRGRVGRRPVKR